MYMIDDVGANVNPKKEINNPKPTLSVTTMSKAIGLEIVSCIYERCVFNLHCNTSIKNCKMLKYRIIDRGLVDSNVPDIH
jgi:hypothetical protein